jgi:hypothetical protein
MAFVVLEFEDDDEAQQVARDIKERTYLFTADQLANMVKVYPENVGVLDDAKALYWKVQDALGWGT